MNLEEANNLVKQIFDLNTTFFEEHLGILWKSPDLKIFDHTDLEALQRNYVVQSVPSNRIDKRNTECALEKNLTKNSDNWKTLRLILEKLPRVMSYFIDGDLNGLLESSEISEKDRSLAELDAIFSVS